MSFTCCDVLSRKRGQAALALVGDRAMHSASMSAPTSTTKANNVITCMLLLHTCHVYFIVGKHTLPWQGMACRGPHGNPPYNSRASHRHESAYNMHSIPCNSRTHGCVSMLSPAGTQLEPLLTVARESRSKSFRRRRPRFDVQTPSK